MFVQAAILRGNIEETEQQKQEEEHIAKSLKQNVEKLSKVNKLNNNTTLYHITLVFIVSGVSN